MGEPATHRRPTPGGYRFPVGPLFAAAQVEHATDLAVRIGVTYRSITRATHDGLNPDVADRWAVAVGMHPAQVWPDWWVGSTEATDA